MRRICTVCARGGSKGVPNKNLRELLGKPLILHTVEQARDSHMFDAIAVSSDSDAILDVAAQFGVTHLVKRPAELADDFAPKIAAIRHCLLETERKSAGLFDTVVDLDATSPLRAPGDIVAAIEQLESSDASNLITGMQSRRSPYFNMVELDNDGFAHLSKAPTKAIVRRQDAPRVFDMNASIYVWRRESIVDNDILFQARTILYVMPEERSIDIDSELDFAFVEFLMQRRSAQRAE
jgi:N-acylneuraminate cytidylyltransferase/CMP-N,N'-diacetyllegionaminic acid synthase